LGLKAVPKALPNLPSVSLRGAWSIMVDLMRGTMMRSVTSLPPVISVPATYGFTAVQSPFGRCSAKVGRRRGWQSRRWRRIIVNLTIYSQIDYNLCWGERGHLDVAATLLQGGKGEIKTPRSSGQALAWRSHEIAYGLLVMTRVVTYGFLPKPQVANSQQLTANSYPPYLLSTSVWRSRRGLPSARVASSTA
jgi:hypothetical protein